MDELSKLLNQPEDRRFEFKEKLPKAEDLAKTVVAFNNDAGGEIFMGIKNKPREIVGLIEQWGTGFRKIQEALKEYPGIELRFSEPGMAFQMQFMKKDYQAESEQAPSKPPAS